MDGEYENGDGFVNGRWQVAISVSLGGTHINALQCHATRHTTLPYRCVLISIKTRVPNKSLGTISTIFPSSAPRSVFNVQIILITINCECAFVRSFVSNTKIQCIISVHYPGTDRKICFSILIKTNYVDFRRLSSRYHSNRFQAEKSHLSIIIFGNCLK